MNQIKRIENLLPLIPNKPGVYRYFDKDDELLYVGKAKNLKSRVSSYFSKNLTNNKLRLLVNKIYDIRCIIVANETDALLLENNLIKKHQPKYNVQLKDDKTYPWICIKNEPFPRVFQTRKLINDGSLYFGPYTSIRLVKTLLDFFQEIYPLRDCNLSLTPKNINANIFNVCLEYHLGNCLGPCVNKQTVEEYQIGIDHIKKIIAGDVKSVIKYFKKNMASASDNLDFEKAQIIKEKLDTLKAYQVKSTIVNPKINNVDVFSIIVEEKHAFVNYLKINNGAIVQSHSLELKKKLNESPEKLLQLAIIDLRKRYRSDSKNIYCSHNIKSLIPETTISSPKKGDKKKLLDLSLRNAKYLQEKILMKKRSVKSKNKEKRILYQLKKDLRLSDYPKHIECFDNSNIQGKAPVSACVVFKNGVPSKKDYRVFNVKTVVGINDVATIKEVVFRRYSRLIKERKNLPELIIVDGGKGQLNSALKSLKKLNLLGKFGVVGIAKKLEKIYFPSDNIPLYLNKRSESLKLIQQMRNEAHRFSLLHHRKKRTANLLSTSLDNINGIGPKTIAVLLSRFGSVQQILSAKKTSLIELIGENKTDKILSFKNT